MRSHCMCLKERWRILWIIQQENSEDYSTDRRVADRKSSTCHCRAHDRAGGRI